MSVASDDKKSDKKKINLEAIKTNKGSERRRIKDPSSMRKEKNENKKDQNSLLLVKVRVGIDKIFL